jgi:alpha-2-macroglobulin
MKILQMKYILLAPFTLLSYILGKFNWTPPLWLNAINGVRRNKPKEFWGVLGGLLLVFIAYTYYQSLPKDITVKALIQSPGITQKHENTVPDDIYIRFSYDFSNLTSDQIRPNGEPSVARIDLVRENIAEGISLEPAKQGRWRWIDDRTLQFIPEADWPAGTEYTVKFDQSIFVKEAKLSEKSYQFSTPKFDINFSSIELYQDPQDISVRRVISTLSFTHPVDKVSFEEKLFLSMRASRSALNKEPKPYKYNVAYDKNQREAYIQSEPVTLPSEPNYMKIFIADGVKTIIGGSATEKQIEKKLLIPDIYSFLKVSSVSSQIIRNERNEPEQLLMLEFTDYISEKELLEKISVYLLPKINEKTGNNYWQASSEVSASVLQNSEKVSIKLVPNERESSKQYSFVIDVPENSFLYMKIARGLESVNKFVHASLYDAVLAVPEYPKEINISGDGSILTYSGEHKLSMLSRGVPALKYKIGRLLEGQLYNLMTQSDGDMKSPSFNNWHFNEDNISEYVDEIVDINMQHPKMASYSSLDLSHYLPNDKNRFGLFFVDVRAWDKQNKLEISGAQDSRLILVTDLGIIVKNNANYTHDVFVQSILTGEPVSGATVELLGKNGIALYEKTTTVDGHVLFPATNDFSNEKQPTVYVVKAGTDLSFIPFNGSSRQINLSRFDIGGVSSNHFRNDSLNAYAFSDRGIYRPGEEINIGFVVKNADLSNVHGIPLEIVVRGPRNNEVKVKKIILPEKGLFDFNYLTDLTSDTGLYNVSLHLIRDEKYRGTEIGSTSFKVQEFQPDTMKIISKLVDVSNIGWSTKESISANAELKNLFGIPAQNRKMIGQVIISPTDLKFKEYDKYTFTDPFFDNSKQALHLDEVLEEKITNADGLANFNIDLQRFREGSYKLQFIVEGFDQAGGRSVVATNTVMISPLDHLLGYKADGTLNYINANSKRSIEFIAIDSALKKVKKSDLIFKRFEVQHLSTLVKQSNGTYKYQTVKKEKELESIDFEISEKSYKYIIDTATPGDFAVEIYDAKKRRLSRVDFSVVGFGNLSAKLDKNSELQLKLNKDDYLPGEIIEMNIKAPYSGAGLISIETDKVHRYKWFKTESVSTLQTIRVPEDLEGTAYVNVTFVRDVGSKEIFTSPLSYAVQPFSIDKSNRQIDVELSVNEIVRPGKPMEITYRASKDSKMVIFAVDEGILQVAKYETPAPLDHFLKKRSLDVQTMQILDLILPEFNLLKEFSASGGGSGDSKALAKNLNPFSRKIDKPAVYWSGIVNGGPEKQKVSFDVPDTFAGSLKVFAVAVSEDAMGVATESSIVRGPFVITPNVLTQVAPGDEFMVSVGIANIIDGSGKNATVDVSVETSNHLELMGTQTTTLKIDEGSEGKFSFKVKAKSVLGVAAITITAKHNEDSMSRAASLSVRPAMPYRTSINAGYEKTGTVGIDVRRKLFSELSTQFVSASASPLVLVDGLTSYLENYPHGCTEQLVSKVFPLVGLMSHPAYQSQVSKIQAYFSPFIDKLRERQLDDGGFSYWPGGRQTDEYPTIYTMHFLIEASELGYAVPADMLNRGKNYLSNYVGRSVSSLDEARDRANAIYLLTRLNVVTTNYLVDLHEYLRNQRIRGWEQDLTASYMAATYKLLQKEDEANRLISAYKLGGVGKSSYDDFHSILAQDAQYIYLLSKHFESLAKNLPGDELLKLTDRIFKGEYNTISSAYSILALGAYSKLALANDFNEDILFSALLTDGKTQQLKSQNKPFKNADYSVNTQKVNIEGKKPLFYLNQQSGFDAELPKIVIRDGIEIYRDFLDNEGNKLTSFEQGKEINVRLRVRGLRDEVLTNIAVIDLLPGGFEVIRNSVSRIANNWQATYVEIREDRIIYYGSFDSKVRELIYKVKLTSAGDFVIPPSYAESMYDRSIRSVSEAGKFKVTSSNTTTK